MKRGSTEPHYYIQPKQKSMNHRINNYFELVNKSELEIEQTGWVSDETDDLLIAAELALTEDDINEIEAEYNSAAREQAEQESYIQHLLMNSYILKSLITGMLRMVMVMLKSLLM